MSSTFVSNTDPYPWPFDGDLDPRHVALVVCGAQRGLLEASPSAACAAARLETAAAAVRQRGGSVIWLRHGCRAATDRASLPVRGSAAWSLVATPAAADIVVDAAGWDGCFGSDLDHTLRAMDVRAVVLGGFASELTVDSTVRTLNDRGHECLVLTDGCAALDDDLGRRAHHSLTMSGGIFGALGTTCSFLDALDRAAHHPIHPPSHRRSS